jgi:hypothetical protein
MRYRESAWPFERGLQEIEALAERAEAPLSDDEWAAIADRLSQLPRKRDLRETRKLIESYLRLYITIDVLNVTEAFAARISDDGSIRLFILEDVEKHRQLAKAIREVVDGYEPSLLPLRDSRSMEELNTLKDQLQKRAQYSEAEVELFERTRSEFAHRGVKRDRNLALLVESLITIWTSMGGRVGASNNGGRGGPLIRFLQTATSLVLRGEPTVEAVRGWVKSFKKGRTPGNPVTVSTIPAMLLDIWPQRVDRLLNDMEAYCRREAARIRGVPE